MKGPKDCLCIIAEHLGASAPKVDPDLIDPKSALAISLSKALSSLTEAKLRKLLEEIYGKKKPGTHIKLFKEVKVLVGNLLDVDSKDDVHIPTAAWKMWPYVINRKEPKMSTNKAATRKKSPSKQKGVAKKTKKVARKERPTKKAASKKAAKITRKGKPAAAKLVKPLNKDSKRGSIVSKFLLKKKNSAESVAEELGTNRSNVMSHMNDANRYHGIGYEVTDSGHVVAQLPKGCKSPWA